MYYDSVKHLLTLSTIFAKRFITDVWQVLRLSASFWSLAYLQLCQISKMECFTRIFNGLSVSYFRKTLHLRCLTGFWNLIGFDGRKQSKFSITVTFFKMLEKSCQFTRERVLLTKCSDLRILFLMISGGVEVINSLQFPVLPRYFTILWDSLANGLPVLYYQSSVKCLRALLIKRNNC